MVTSSWAEQFANIARQIGDEPWGVREAKAVFELVPELNRAAPALYDVHGGQATRTCQRRSACCLYFKSSARYFCASCPIIPEFERLERNRAWVAEQLSEPRLTREQIKNLEAVTRRELLNAMKRRTNTVFLGRRRPRNSGKVRHAFSCFVHRRCSA
jgi:hypothetical protein